jgi:acyl-CoA synthetase (NDP forming)
MKDSTIMISNSLDFLLAPKSIAIVGASPKKDSNGLAMVEMCKIDGYSGSVFLINPNYDKINGEKCYAKLEDLNTRPDHVIIGVALVDMSKIFLINV